MTSWNLSVSGEKQGKAIMLRVHAIVMHESGVLGNVYIHACPIDYVPLYAGMTPRKESHYRHIREKERISLYAK